MAYVAWSVSFGEQPSAAKWNILGTNDAYFDAQIGSGTAWASWTPTYVNITVGNGTVVNKYIQIGKIVHAYWKLTCGGTTTIANANTVTIPVTASSNMSINIPVGTAFVFDDSVSQRYAGWVKLTTTGIVGFDWTIAGSEPQVTTNFPITEATSDTYAFSITYEAA